MQETLVRFLGWEDLLDYSPWGPKELAMTE